MNFGVLLKCLKVTTGSTGSHRIRVRDTGRSSSASHHVDAKDTDVWTSTSAPPRFEIHWPKLVTGSYGNVSLDFRVSG